MGGLRILITQTFLPLLLLVVGGAEVLARSAPSQTKVQFRPVRDLSSHPISGKSFKQCNKIFGLFWKNCEWINTQVCTCKYLVAKYTTNPALVADNELYKRQADGASTTEGTTTTTPPPPPSTTLETGTTAVPASESSTPAPSSEPPPGTKIGTVVANAKAEEGTAAANGSIFGNTLFT